MYLYIKDNIAINLIPEFDDNLPGTPLNQRYTPDILKNTIEVPENVEVKLGWLVDTATWTFTEPPSPESPIQPEPFSLFDYKLKAIDQTNNWLHKTLEEPMPWIDGKLYTVTLEKQTILLAALAMYDLYLKMGKQYNLEWNATGEECVPWTIENLSALSIAIDLFVKPFIKKQRRGEVSINAATTIEEIDHIRQNYT